MWLTFCRANLINFEWSSFVTDLQGSVFSVFILFLFFSLEFWGGFNLSHRFSVFVQIGLSRNQLTQKAPNLLKKLP